VLYLYAQVSVCGTNPSNPRQGTETRSATVFPLCKRATSTNPSNPRQGTETTICAFRASTCSTWYQSIESPSGD